MTGGIVPREERRNAMKRIVIVGILVAAMLFVTAAAAVERQRGGPDWNYCPYCGSNLSDDEFMGPGMMGRDRGPWPGWMHRGEGPGPGMMYRDWDRGPGMMYRGFGYGPEDTPECRKFLDDTMDLRKQFMEKQFDYSEALRNPQTTTETLSKLQKEIADLQVEIFRKSPRGCWR